VLIAPHRSRIDSPVCGEHQRPGVEFEGRLAFVEVAGRELQACIGHVEPGVASVRTRTRADRRSRTTGNIFLEVRRETTGLLAAALGDERLRQLRAEGETMKDDGAIAYTLDQIAKALTDSSPQ